MPAKIRAIQTLTEGSIQPEKAPAENISSESVAPLIRTHDTDHSSKSFTDLTLHRIERWGGRLAMTNMADAALNQFPQLGIKPSSESIEALHSAAENHLFPKPLGYDKLLGLKEEALTISEIKEAGLNPFSGKRIRRGLQENFGGFNPAQVVREETLTGTQFINRTLWQANCQSVFKPLQEGSQKVFTCLGAGLVAVISAIEVLDKTAKQYQREAQKEKLGQQNHPQTLAHTAVHFSKISTVNLLSWEAANIGSKVGKALLIIVPSQHVAKLVAITLATVITGSLFATITHQLALKAIKLSEN
jgi:hypothetical protein